MGVPPDISVFRTEPGSRPLPRRGAIDAAPDWAIEVLSPDDRVSQWLERVRLYMDAGTSLLWVVDPEEETIRAFRPGEPTQVYRAGDLADASPVLGAFELDVADFFGTLRELAGEPGG